MKKGIDVFKEVIATALNQKEIETKEAINKKMNNVTKIFREIGITI